MNQYEKHEKIMIEKMLKEGKSIPFIANVLGRTRWGVRNQIQRNGGRDHYSSSLSEKNREEGEKRRKHFHQTTCKTEGWGKASGIWKKSSISKLHSLEEQLKIVTQLIMEEYD